MDKVLITVGNGRPARPLRRVTAAVICQRCTDSSSGDRYETFVHAPVRASREQCSAYPVVLAYLPA